MNFYIRENLAAPIEGPFSTEQINLRIRVGAVTLEWLAIPQSDHESEQMTTLTTTSWVPIGSVHELSCPRVVESGALRKSELDPHGGAVGSCLRILIGIIVGVSILLAILYEGCRAGRF